MSRKPRSPVYIDPSTNRTASDITNPEHCRKLIARLTRNIEELNKLHPHTREQRSALYYKKLAIIELTNQLASLKKDIPHADASPE